VRALLDDLQVNVGCVPKKVMWNAAFVKDVVEHADEYGHNIDMSTYSFDWDRLKTSRDGYVTRLNGIYAGNLDNSGVTLLRGHARFDGESGKVVVETDDGSSTSLTADHVLITTGGAPLIPADVPGAQEHGIDSDGFFDIAALPKKVAVVGAGYIAVELAGVLNVLGSETELFVRKEGVLRGFDADVAAFLNKELVHDGAESALLLASHFHI
jgi:glutathione reductase (NADPH)